jgi:hypothetical protein
VSICIFILAIMAILLFYLSASIEHYQLIEVIDGISIPVSQGWQLLYSLWPAMSFMFFAGIFVVLMIMKLWKSPETQQQE